MRLSLFPVALAALVGCAPGIPDSAAGVSGLPASRAISDETATAIPQSADMTTATTALAPAAAAAAAGTTTATGDTDLAAETRAALVAARANSGQMPVQADPQNPPPRTVATASGISEENDFAAVDSVRGIESDADLLARNRARYQVVQPTALPARTSDSGPNIVAFALSMSHPIGTRVHTRIGINKQARFARNCAKYASDDLAQIDFLDRGGPARDWLGLDPDGDGYACGWDPAPFRRAVQG